MILRSHDFTFMIEDKIFQDFVDLLGNVVTESEDFRRNSYRNLNYLSSFPMSKG